jgi:hypothetical protein
MADPQAYTDDLKRFQSQLDDIRKQLRNLRTPTDSQFNRVVQQMLEIVNNIDTIVADSIARTSYSASTIDSKDVATLNAAKSYAEPKIGILPANKGGTNTTNGYANLFSTGPYRAAWLLSDGTLGTSQSSRTVKTDFHEPDISLEQLRAVDWIGYRYINDVNQNSDSALPRIGMIAEELDDAGLGIFVVYDDETLAPVSIDYATLSVAAMHMARLAHDRIDAYWG